MSKLHAPFWDSSLHVFLFWLWQGRFRTIGKIFTMPEPKENYTHGTASISLRARPYCCDCINTQHFDGTRLAPQGRSNRSFTTVQWFSSGYSSSMTLDFPLVEDPVVALQLFSDSHLGTHCWRARIRAKQLKHDFK